MPQQLWMKIAMEQAFTIYQISNMSIEQIQVLRILYSPTKICRIYAAVRTSTRRLVFYKVNFLPLRFIKVMIKRKSAKLCQSRVLQSKTEANRVAIYHYFATSIQSKSNLNLASCSSLALFAHLYASLAS